MTIHVARGQANKAGRVLRTIDMTDSVSQNQKDAIITATRWRSQHVKATETCFSTVLDCASAIDGTVATYRMKRMTSIIRKLQRPSSHLKLGELDDIGGCRLIVNTIDDVNTATDILKNRLSLKNGNGDKNYIDSPQQSGYRSRHLIAKINEEETCLHVEIQIRTRLQHCWATANAAMGKYILRNTKARKYKATRVGQTLKGLSSSQLSPACSRFMRAHHRFRDIRNPKNR
ncbi:GTP pyrophosphokinase family protein [uncultured Bifidobacterium sp.]|uniref:GTP pyrophosphokinase n=1 Tax=uncultured Bifidobacterium sp. TaxID=165187 RepID=UPI0026378E07|nr:RelA/SpoT domain-containing protein [uncultured Bifidobacterium sp.]